jgi:nitrite reductase/ring-hydroxylating ferredoxin subunit
MERNDLQRTFWQRLLGLPATPQPADSGCWAFSGGKVVIDLGMAPELQKPGSALRLEGKGLPRRLLVLHGEDGGFHAFHNRCTHLGHRRVDPVPGTRTIQCCSVNKSTYSYDGATLRGPAPGPLTAYPATLEGQRLVIKLA